jgi:PhnB protein
MACINPFIHFNGNAEEAFSFYQSIFGGTVTVLSRLKDFSSPGQNLSDEEKNKVMKIILPMDNGSVLMASDVPEFLGRVHERENRSKIFVQATDGDEAAKIFNGLSAGGEIEIPLTKSDGGSYFGMLRDKFGIEWMVEFAGVGQK